MQPRRAQLSELLEQEDKQFKEEILSMQETPEQTRARMVQRVQQLKEEKEKARSAEVNAKLERRFEMNADELRQVDQDIKQQKLAYERSLQLVDKQNNYQQQYEGTLHIRQRRCCSQR